jgi:hypothetical protein
MSSNSHAGFKAREDSPSIKTCFEQSDEIVVRKK